MRRRCAGPGGSGEGWHGSRHGGELQETVNLQVDVEYSPGCVMSVGFVVGIALIVVGTICLRAVPGSERLAVFEFGEFRRLKGPGIVLVPPFGPSERMTEGLGKRGELIATDKARFCDRVIPASLTDELPVGAQIRVVGFAEDKVLIALDQVAREATCPKCSFTFQVTS